MDVAARLAPGAAGVWLAAGCRVAAGRGWDEELPSKVSEISIAPLTSPRGPDPPLVEAGAAWDGLELEEFCSLLSREGP